MITALFASAYWMRLYLSCSCNHSLKDDVGKTVWLRFDDSLVACNGSYIRYRIQLNLIAEWVCVGEWTMKTNNDPPDNDGDDDD